MIGGQGDLCERFPDTCLANELIVQRYTPEDIAADQAGFGVWNALSIGVGFIPIVGSIQSVVEFGTGHDHIGGESTSRWLAAGGIFAGVLPGGKGLLKSGSKAVIMIFRHADDVPAGQVMRAVAPIRGAGIADDAAELAAQQSLTALQGSIQSGHFLTRHSPMMKLDDLYQRATQGILPDGTQSFKTNASRFLKYTDMEEAIDKAIRSYRAAGQSGEPVVIDMLREIGEGYYRTSGIYGRTSKVVVYFDEFGQPITAFPLLPKLP